LAHLRQFGSLVMFGIFVVGALLNAPLLKGQGKPDPSQKDKNAHVTPASLGATSKDGKKGTTSAAPAKSSFSESGTPSGTVTSDADGDAYRIGVEDELQISVWHEPELTVGVVVRPDGKITMPLLNDISVVGLRTDELQLQLTDALKAFVNEPQVTVIVRAIHSRKVYLVGQVTRPGSYPLIGKKTVVELIAEAGGLGPFAKASAIYVLRSQQGHSTRISVNYSKIIKGRSEENILLAPGDMVVVP
jgi:polysaccharide export outer membrane protein